MFARLRDMLAKKEIDADKKDVVFEKGDSLALFLAAGSIMFPVLILIFMSIALFVWIIF